MRLICLLGLLFSSVPIMGQIKAPLSNTPFPLITEFQFTHLTEEHGLSDNHPWAVYMDKQGFLWLGTPDGISRYDGKQFLNIGEMPTADGVIESSMVVDILEDEDGILWLASLGDGLIRYNPIDETFRAYKYDNQSVNSISGNDVSCLLARPDGKIWVGTYSSGFNLFNPQEETFIRYNLSNSVNNASEAFRLNSVHEMLIDPGGRDYLWLAANNGIYKLDINKEKIVRYASSAPNTSGMSCHALWPQGKNGLWVGTWGGGVILFDIVQETWDYFPPYPKAWENRSSTTNIVYDIRQKAPNELWVCTQDQGLLVFDTDKKSYTQLPFGESDPFKLPENAIRKIYVDPQGRIWILNYNQGLSLATPANELFKFHAMNSRLCTEDETHEMSDFVWDDKLKRIYATYQGCEGLYIFDENDQLMPPPTHEVETQERHGYKTILIDSEGVVWLGGKRNIGNEGQVIPQTSFLRYFPQENNLVPVEANIPIQEYDVLDIIEDKANQLWLGTKGGGLVRISENRNQYEQFVKSEANPDYLNEQVRIYELAEDDLGNIWIATEASGVYIFNPQNERFTSIPTESKEIRTITKDKDGDIWIGMKDASIEVFDPQTSTETPIKKIRKSDGLASKRITKIICDVQGDIWIATESGLCRYQKESNKIITFTAKNGLKDTYLLQMGLKQIKSGEILIGQKTGFFSLIPEDLYRETATQALVFTDMESFGKSLKFEKNLNFMDEIVLNYEQNFFSLDFIMLDYDPIDKHQYAYQLVGYDGDWVYPRDGNMTASYTNVREGNYTFQLKAENILNGKVLGHRSVDIRILPPWYRSWWAYIIYTLIVLAMIGSLAWQLRQRTRLRHQRELEALELKKMKELDELKTRFFANISHEFRTPLTIIQGLSDEMINKIYRMERGIISDRVKTIHRNSRQLLNLVKQILDLAKLESNALKPHFIQDDIIPYLTYLVESFESLAELKGINLEINCEVSSLMMDYDPERIKDIINNLLSNAIKFSPNHSQVRVNIRKKSNAHLSSEKHPELQEFLSVEVIDNGAGIPADKLPHIFERFFQADDGTARAYEGTGIGLALCKELVELFGGNIEAESKLGHGTAFKILLPIFNDAGFEAVTLPSPKSEQIELIEELPLLPLVAEGDEKPLVLLVEDNKDVLDYIRICLADNYKLMEAKDGEEGIQKAQKAIPDLIVSDVMMPKKDGFELINALKQDEKTSHIPIILLTARAAVEDKLAGLKRGAEAYLTKPFNKEELLIRIHGLLAIRQKLRERYAALGALSPSPDLATQQEDNFLIKLHQELIEHLSDPELDVPKLADAVSMSRSQLHRKLKAVTGYAANAYIRTFRLKRGQQMLRETDMSIAEVAYAVGFNDPNYFSRVFSKEFDKTPSEFRSNPEHLEE